MIDQEKYISQGNEREYASELDYFNARFYDADLGRFNGVDPLASQFPSQSPFMSMDGNPVMKVDPTGLFADDIYYNHGREVARIENDKPDRYFYVNKAENGGWTVEREFFKQGDDYFTDIRFSRATKGIFDDRTYDAQFWDNYKQFINYGLNMVEMTLLATTFNIGGGQKWQNRK